MKIIVFILIIFMNSPVFSNEIKIDNNPQPIESLGRWFLYNNQELKTINDFKSVLYHFTETRQLYDRSLKFYTAHKIFTGDLIFNYVSGVTLLIINLFIPMGWPLIIPMIYAYSLGLTDLILVIALGAHSSKLKKKAILLYNKMVKENKVSIKNDFIDNSIYVYGSIKL